MKLYTDSGWVNMPAIIDEGYPFTFIVGGRGTGKTYGGLLEARNRSTPNSRFMLLRRTQAQVELISRPEFSPFKAIDNDMGFVTISQPLTKYTTGFYNGQEQDDGSFKPAGSLLGYTAALSTFANIRGADFSDITNVYWDEFIPQEQERPIKNEAQAFLNLYETINRNRELLGRKPVQMICMANANTLGNPIFLELQLVRIAERMRLQGREVWKDNNRGIMIVLLQNSPISDAKAKTTLYKMQSGTEFSRMALDNDFAFEERGESGRLPLKELVPIVQVGEICIYRRKAGGYYCSSHCSGSPDRYGTGPRELERFKRKYIWIWQAYLNRSILFEEYVCEILLTKYFS